ncbi:YSC84-related protein [Thalassotalea aquiviva]|uniref:lipid-binding SYLF domain-containing protein n=1 Tax=Thalassotalea aquiviva TaxID=3242415 RepID=UPI00352A5E87
MKNRLLHYCTFTLTLLFLSACSSIASDQPSIAEQRQEVLTMKDNVLNELYKLKPDTRSQLAKAPGYAVFSNVNINLILASFGGGHGVVKNNRNGKHTFMKMGEAGVGLGLGAKDFRVVFVFHTADVMTRFIESGWAFGAQADAAAKASEKGAAIGGEITADNFTIYQLTQSGLALQATVKGTKYWVDEDLNGQ